MSMSEPMEDEIWGENDGEQKETDASWDDAPAEDEDDMSAPAIKRQQSAPGFAETYTILEARELQDRRLGLEKKVAELLSITVPEAGCLLRAYNWKHLRVQQE